MTHLKRILWLSAWSVWVWLGFGLYRELPRDLGPVVCKLAFAESEEPLGFLHGEDVVVSRFQKDGVDESLITLWNARSGSKLHEWRAPSFGNNWRGRSSISLRHGVVVGVRPDDASEDLKILDLRNGDWRPVTDRPREVLDFHPTKPWAAATVRSDSEDVQRLVVFNLQTGEVVARWRGRLPPDGRVDSVEAGRFRDDGSDELLLFMERLDPEQNVTKRFEFWTIGGEPSASPAPLKDPNVDLGSGWSWNGNVVLTRYYAWRDHEPYVVVVESRSGEPILSSDSVPELFKLDRLQRFSSDSQLSASGQSFLSIYQELWNVAERRRVWSAHEKFEYIFKAGASNEAFLVFEHWKQLLGTKWLPFEGRTWAVREFDTGAVRYRAAHQHPLLNHFSSDGHLGVMFLGEVYAFPLPPNWPLLALCQMILASPLVLLWSALRWRRRRAARRQAIEIGFEN
jgi:hypothetical protein